MNYIEEARKELENYSKNLPKKKYMCLKQECISCIDNECENKKLISAKSERLILALKKTYSPISAYIETDKLKYIKG